MNMTKTIRILEPCPKHKAAADLGNGTWCPITRIDNALRHASDCNECLSIVVEFMNSQNG